MIEKYKKQLITIIHRHVHSCTIYLFGSRARKTNKEGADVDLALDAGKKIDLNVILTIKDEIEQTTIPVFVDVVDFQSAPKELKEEIKKDGILWTD